MYGLKKNSLQSWEKAPANQNTRGFEGEGMGDFYGTGVRNPQAKQRSPLLGSATPATLKNSPKALA